MRPYSFLLKRVADLVIASATLIAFTPLMALLWLLIKLDSRGPALFLQSRSGLHGNEFRVIKFRTMTLGTKPEVGKETTADDPRITRIGHVLRRSGLDELPQLFNVLKGEMSIVGPRPLLAWENHQCNPRQAARLTVKPGLTGLSQVMGRNNIPWHERVAWDLVYIERRSFWLDLKIIVWTLPVVLLGRNAYLDLGTTEGISAYLTE